MHKVRESGISKDNTNKRRRPSKKLAADIGDLEDALPDMDEDDDDEWEGLSGEEDGDGTATTMQKKRRRRRKPAPEDQGIMVMKSLKLRQGAMKRKRVMEESEKVRFGRNLAQLAQAQAPVAGEKGNGEVGGQSHTQQRWQALRAFIGGTMEKNAAFAGP